MNNKDKIVFVLERLCVKYKTMPDKKFQLRAIQTAVSNLKKYTGDDITNGKDAAKKVSGISKGIIKRIDEILLKGNLKELGTDSTDPTSGTPVAKRAKKGDKGIINVTGIGPVRAKKLIDEGCTDIDGLRAGVKAGKIKLTHHQKIGVKYYEDFLERIPRDEIVKMEKILKHTAQKVILEVCGSYRRGRNDCGDIDVLMTTGNPTGSDATSASAFLRMYVKQLTDSGFIVDHLTTNIKTKYMGVCKSSDGVARRIDIRAVPYHCFYPALIYFTGSKEFNIEIRRKALEKGYSLSEYGFKKVDDGSMISFDSEKDIFDFLGLDYVDPVKR